MSKDTVISRSYVATFLRLALLAACLLCLSVVEVAAQQTPAPAAAPATPSDPAEAPAFREYKGVSIGMSAAEARKKLGTPTEKGDTQDFYVVSEKETVQVMYDGAKKVSALAIIYMNAGADAPSAKVVMGADLEAKADGSLYKMVRYPKAGYWVSYSRTAGASPIVSVTMQKMN